jgi:hypothetical protein
MCADFQGCYLYPQMANLTESESHDWMFPYLYVVAYALLVVYGEVNLDPAVVYQALRP